MVVTLRADRPDDRDAILDLLRTSLRAGEGDDTDGLGRLLWRDPAEQSFVYVAADAGDVVGVVGGSTAVRDGERRAYVKVIAVDAAHRRRDVGRHLLAVLEEAAMEAGASAMQVGGSAPAYWWPGVDTAAADTLAFFAACGYERPADHTATNLDVDLTAHEALVRHPAPPDLPMRRLAAADRPAFEDWLREVWGDAWAAEGTAALAREPASCFVAVEDGRYLGFAAYDTNRAGWFGPMGTDPSATGRGVGSALLRACLADYLDAGRTRCEIAWVGPVDFYARTVGAVPGRTFVALTKSLAA
jgi:mycothiol synthase